MESSSAKLDGVSAWINSQTAGFCQDYQGPKEFHQPKSRVLVRLLFTLGVCLLAILSVLIFLFTEESTFKTVRYWGSNYALEQFTPFITNGNARLDPTYKSRTASTICPCSNTAFTWTSYVDFFTIYYNPPQDPIRTAVVTSGSDFCINTVKSFPLNSSLISRAGCPNLINSVVDKDDTRTILSSSSLMDPILLNATIQRYVQANLEKALNECVFLMSNETSWNATEPFEWLRNIYEAYTAMLQLYGSNPYASDREFWNVANETITSSRSHLPLIQVIDLKLSLGMQVNWNKYVGECSPIYCDVVKEITLGSKFFGAMAQIGGFGALMLLVIRKIVWPLIRILGRWKIQ
ncbi:hypothetical protein L7F22_024508 [Adiantum nelumboides]|nr:hypothetical protein [Adiantum nelumboides]